MPRVYYVDAPQTGRMVGPFPDKRAAEDYARAYLEPFGAAWTLLHSNGLGPDRLTIDRTVIVVED